MIVEDLKINNYTFSSQPAIVQVVYRQFDSAVRHRQYQADMPLPLLLALLSGRPLARWCGKNSGVTSTTTPEAYYQFPPQHPT